MIFSADSIAVSSSSAEAGHYSVRGDIDGDGHADFEINVEMTHFDDVLTPADILL